MTHYCKNHVGREAKRRCFFCRSYICPECQLRFYGHIFCGVFCVLRYFPFHLKRQLRSWYKNRLRNISINWTLVLLALLAASLFGNIFQFIFFHRSAALLNPPKNADAPIKTALIDSNQITITFPKGGTTLHQNYIKIRGTGPEDGLVIIEGKRMAATVDKIQRGCFELSEIPLSPGKNKFWLTAVSPSGFVSHDSFVIQYVSPERTDLSGDFIRGNIQYNQVALTFDGDFLDNQADSILAILKRQNTPATFFLTGRFVLKYPELVRKLTQTQCVIGNHTRYHPHLTTYAENGKHLTRPEMTEEIFRKELLETEKIFERATGQKMERIWRAPFGEHNSQIRQWAAKIGYRQFGWTADYANHQTLDTVDWVADQEATNYYSAAEILERLVHFADSTPYGMNGGIVLMHLGSQRKESQSYQMLGALIDSLDSRGYQFVTIMDMAF